MPINIQERGFSYEHIPQMNLFEESDSENPGDLERLPMVLETLDDGKLIRQLYRILERGRNDWFCEAMWNSFIASFLFPKNLISCQEDLNEMFTELVLYVYGNLERFGETLMVDGKAIQSFGTVPVKTGRAAGVGSMMLTGAKSSTVQATQTGNP